MANLAAGQSAADAEGYIVSPTPLDDLISYVRSDPVLKQFQFWTYLSPPNACMPYAVITPISMVPVWLTGSDYLEPFIFQIAVFTNNDPGGCERMASAIAGRLDWSGDHFSNCAQGYDAIGGMCYGGCMRKDGPILRASLEELPNIWMSVMSYQLLINRTMPAI